MRMAIKRRIQVAVTNVTRSNNLGLCTRAARPNYLSSFGHATHPSRTYSTPVKAPRSSSPTARITFGGAAILAVAAAIWVVNSPILHAEAPTSDTQGKGNIRLAEVQKHGRDADRKWVTRGVRVYDITDWIPGHPGGEVILKAVGGPVDQYWNIFTVHQKQDVYDTLESYYIGDIDKQDLVDGRVPVEDIHDPFENDPKRDDRLHVHSSRPCNAETPTGNLDAFVTANEVFYVRNHMWVPSTSESEHKVVVELPDGEEKEYSLEDLKINFKPTRVTATLQCSGNRRSDMTQESHSTNGLQWRVGGISTSEWTGVRLRDVLADAGFPVDEYPNEVRHAQFLGAEAYGASIPIDKAVDRRGDVLLAYEMDGQPLPPDHGYPIRVLVPGTVAARSVKWVNRIILSEEESQSQWQQRDYKCFGPNVSGNPDWSTAPAIQEVPVQSAITSLRDISPQSHADRKYLQENGLEEDSVAVEGYSFAGGGRRIVRVDISANDGRTWHQAELLPDQGKGSKAWAWTRWRWVVPRRQAGRCFVVKAVDEAYNTQPDDYDANYNFRGNLTSSWHRVGYRPPSTESHK